MSITEWIAKLPIWVKIPLRIFLPALCIFSGFLLLISDELADKLYLKEFRQESGFAFGIIFIITLSLILVYIIFFASKPAFENVKNYFTKRAMIKKFINLEDIYKQALYEMYKSPTHSMKMDISNAVASYLVNIYAVNCAKVSVQGYLFDFYIQPWAIWGIEYEIKQSQKVINRFKRYEKLLKKSKSYDEYLEAYESHKEFLKYINEANDSDYSSVA